MRTRHERAWSVGAALCGVVLAIPVLAAGQQNARELGGVWDFRSVVPFERPEEFSGKQTLTEEEAAAFVRLRIDALNVDLRRDENGRVPLSGGYNNFWYDRGASLGGRTPDVAGCGPL